MEAPRPPTPVEPGTHAGTGLLGIAQSLLPIVVIAVFVITFIIQAFQIPTPSMESTLLVGDYLLVDKLHYGGDFGSPLLPYRTIHRGDIIVFHYPVKPEQHFVKRVIGVPGDRLRLINQQVFINGAPLPEPYVRHVLGDHQAFRDEFPRVDVTTAGVEASWWLQMRKLIDHNQLIVPEGNYFVMGDNRDDSHDSRYWGFVPQETVIGRPLIIYWSVRAADLDMPASPTAGDKLLHFAYMSTHILQMTRWDRTLRIVN